MLSIRLLFAFVFIAQAGACATTHSGGSSGTPGWTANAAAWSALGASITKAAGAVYAWTEYERQLDAIERGKERASVVPCAGCSALNRAAERTLIDEMGGARAWSYALAGLSAASFIGSVVMFVVMSKATPGATADGPSIPSVNVSPFAANGAAGLQGQITF